jgi:hypothetical protein
MEINAMTRFEKIEYLCETCSEKFIKDCTVLQEMVRWMDEDDFSKFFDNLCRLWEIDLNDDEDEEDVRNEFTIEDDECVFTDEESIAIENDLMIPA